MLKNVKGGGEGLFDVDNVLEMVLIDEACGSGVWSRAFGGGEDGPARGGDGNVCEVDVTDGAFGCGGGRGGGSRNEGRGCLPSFQSRD